MSFRRCRVRDPLLLCCVAAALSACDRSPPAQSTDVRQEAASPHFRNVDSATAYVGDGACATCHVPEAKAYQQHAMAQSFQSWNSAKRIEKNPDSPVYDAATGYSYSIENSGGWLYEVESLGGTGGKRVHQLRRRIDYVMGSGRVARTYFTEENGRLFQLPLTWYRSHGWDFSPGYEVNNARFDRVLLDRCVACHASYPANGRDRADHTEFVGWRALDVE